MADVRSAPFSPRHPSFNREELQAALRQMGLAYVFLGDQLGGRPEDLDLYDRDGRVDYERVRATRSFQQGLERLNDGLTRHSLALLCAEEDPLDCHRGLMIAPALLERGLHPEHIRGDGSIETTEALEKRLLTETRVGTGILDGLFAASISAAERRELIRDAYRKMARRKAFRARPDGGADAMES